MNSGIERVKEVSHSQLDVSAELPKHVLEHGHRPPLWAKEEYCSPANHTSMDLIKFFMISHSYS